MKPMSVFRIYVEKKPEFAVEAQSLLSDIRTALRLDITSIRVINRYDADKITKEDFQLSVSTRRSPGHPAPVCFVPGQPPASACPAA